MKSSCKVESTLSVNDFRVSALIISIKNVSDKYVPLSNITITLCVYDSNISYKILHIASLVSSLSLAFNNSYSFTQLMNEINLYHQGYFLGLLFVRISHF